MKKMVPIDRAGFGGFRSRKPQNATGGTLFNDLRRGRLQMATKAAAARESEANNKTEPATDGPLMDSVTAAVKKLIAK